MFPLSALIAEGRKDGGQSRAFGAIFPISINERVLFCSRARCFAPFTPSPYFPSPSKKPTPQKGLEKGLLHDRSPGVFGLFLFRIVF